MRLLDQYVVDVSLVLAYISNVLYNPDAAEKLKNNIDKMLDTIENNPYIYSIHKGKVIYKHEYRKAKVGNYYIFYYIEDDIITIARFIYTARNIDNILM